MRKELLVFVLLAMIAISCQSNSAANKESEIITQNDGAQTQQLSLLAPKEFVKKFKEKAEAQLIDVRTPEEVAEGALEGAVNINIYDADFKEKLSKLDKDKAIFIYCRSGGRSGQCSQICKEMGFKEIYDMQGGWLSYSSGN